MGCCGSKRSQEGLSELLLSIPGAVVHLVDGAQSVHLASGDLSLIRLIEDGKGIAVVGMVGEQLQWPLLRDVPAGKLDNRHYFFLTKVPGALDEEEDHGQPPSLLAYGLTFTDTNIDPELLAQLDRLLEQYSLFCVPSVVHGAAELGVDGDESSGKSRSVLDLLCGRILASSKARKESTSASPVEKQRLEESSAAYWTILAPNVEDYSSSLARGIAIGTGHIIKGIFWCSDATLEQLEKACLYMKERVKPGEQPTNISPRTLRNLRRVRKMSAMTQHLANAVLSGILSTTGIISGTLIKSNAGKQFFKWMPGSEIALVSMDAFGKVLDALEEAGQKILTSTNTAASEMVSHRFGEQAGEAARESFASAGHVVGTAWTCTKIRKALTPNTGSGATTLKSRLAKSAGKAVLRKRNP